MIKLFIKNNASEEWQFGSITVSEEIVVPMLELPANEMITLHQPTEEEIKNAKGLPHRFNHKDASQIKITIMGKSIEYHSRRIIQHICLRVQ